MHDANPPEDRTGILAKPGPRAKTLLLAALLALGLAIGLYASSGAQPAEAYARNVCSHETTLHRGPDGRWHGQTFEDSWNTWNGNKKTHWHRIGHWRKYGGEWHHTWWATYRCNHPVIASVPSGPSGSDPAEAPSEPLPEHPGRAATASEERAVHEHHGHEH